MRTTNFTQMGERERFGMRAGVRALLAGAALALFTGVSFATAIVPFIQELKPTSATPGGADFTLTIDGINFMGGTTVVKWNGVALVNPATCTFTQCTVTVPAANIATAGTAIVTVSNDPAAAGTPPPPPPPPPFSDSNALLFPISVTAPATFANLPTIAVGKVPLNVVLGDFNADGIQDLAVVNSADNNVTILLGNGDGTFKAATGSPVNLGHNPQGATVGDFNNDSKLDLAVVNKDDNTVSILLGNGDGTFKQASGSPFSPLTGVAPIAVATADLIGDGALALFVLN